MSEAMFTPGPWESGGSIVGAGNIIIRQQWECVRKSIDELQANAYLIAAAPDMYEALEAVNQSSEWEYMESDVQEAVVSALAKARGET